MGNFTICSFLREQWNTIPVPNADISDKTIVITGANVGLGFEAAVHFGNLQPKRLVLTARDEDKAKQTIRDLERRSTIRDAEAWPLELNSFDSVRRFADKVEAQCASVNAFIANAAVWTTTYVRTKDGWESTLQVNYLSMALFSILMLPHLMKSTTPTNASRLVIVSSKGHFLADKLEGAIKWHSILMRLNDEGYCTASVMKKRYHLSKLLGIMFVRELASRLPNPTPISVSAVHPGFSNTHITRSFESNPVIRAVLRVGKTLFARTAEVGSRTLVHAAIGPGERKRHGRYVSSCEVAEESDYVLSEEGKQISRRIWTETIEILVRIDPRVNQIISEHLLAC